MKRLYKYLLFVAVIFAVTASICIYIPYDFSVENNFISSVANKQNNPSSDFHLSQSDFPISPGNQQLRNIKISSPALGRITTFIYSFSIFRSTRLNYQKLFLANTTFELYYSILQGNGYYLYHLRKMLI